MQQEACAVFLSLRTDANCCALQLIVFCLPSQQPVLASVQVHVAFLLFLVIAVLRTDDKWLAGATNCVTRHSQEVLHLLNSILYAWSERVVGRSASMFVF
jgi:hypothetical protein